MIQQLKKCERCGKLTIPSYSMGITNVFNKYKVGFAVQADGSPVTICNECFARIVTQAGKKLCELLKVKEDNNER